MPGFYYAPVDADTITATQGIFEIQPATDNPVRLWAFEISNLTETGDAQEEMLELHLIRRTGAPTSGSGGATVTAQPSTQGAAADSATVSENDTTEASGGTAELMIKVAWNVRIPYLWQAPHEQGAISVTDNDLITLDLITTPADTLDVLGWVLFEEI